MSDKTTIKTFQATVTNAAPETVVHQGTVERADRIVVSGHSPVASRDITITLRQVKPYAAFRYEYPLAITGNSNSKDHVLVAKAVKGPFEVVVVNNSGADATGVEIQVDTEVD